MSTKQGHLGWPLRYALSIKEPPSGRLLRAVQTTAEREWFLARAQEKRDRRAMRNIREADAMGLVLS